MDWRNPYSVALPPSVLAALGFSATNGRNESVSGRTDTPDVIILKQCAILFFRGERVVALSHVPASV